MKELSRNAGGDIEDCDMEEEEGDSEEEPLTRDSGDGGLVLRFRGASCLG